MTRKQRASGVKRRNSLAKYSKGAREVLEAILEKYADEGFKHIESLEILKIEPFKSFGGPADIIARFGSKQEYKQAIFELEQELYKAG